jgi:hypothetical protein
MQINGINDYNYKLTGKPKLSFGSSRSDDYTITKKANKTDIGIGVACALGAGALIAYLRRNVSPTIVPKSVEIIGGALNAGLLGLITSNILRKSDKPDS